MWKGMRAFSHGTDFRAQVELNNRPTPQAHSCSLFITPRFTTKCHRSFMFYSCLFTRSVKQYNHAWNNTSGRWRSLQSKKCQTKKKVGKHPQVIWDCLQVPATTFAIQRTLVPMRDENGINRRPWHEWKICMSAVWRSLLNNLLCGGVAYWWIRTCFIHGCRAQMTGR